MREVEQPPVLKPGEKPSPAEMSKLARQLLHEMAKDDAELAEKMRSRGIEPNAS